MSDRVTSRIDGWGSLDAEKDKAFRELSWEERMALLLQNEETLERAFHRLDDTLDDELSHLLPMPEAVARHAEHHAAPSEKSIAVVADTSMPTEAMVEIDIIDEVTVFNEFVRRSLESEGIEFPAPDTVISQSPSVLVA